MSHHITSLQLKNDISHIYRICFNGNTNCGDLDWWKTFALQFKGFCDLDKISNLNVLYNDPNTRTVYYTMDGACRQSNNGLFWMHEIVSLYYNEKGYVTEYHIQLYFG